MKRNLNFVLYMVVLVVAVIMFNGCGLVYYGQYSGKAPNAQYRGDNQGTPGLRVKPLELSVTQEQLMAMSPEEFDAYMGKLDRYNESMRNASYTEGYDASMKSGWTRRNISAPAAPQSIASPSEMRRLRQAELDARRNGQQGAAVSVPMPCRADYRSEREFRMAYKYWMLNH